MKTGHWVGEHLAAAARGLALGALTPILVPLAVLSMLVLPMVPGAPVAFRRVVNLNRRLAGRWCGVPVDVPYRPQPGPLPGQPGYLRRLRWMTRDPATWRDLLWAALVSVAGWLVAALPGGLVLYGCAAFLAEVSGTRGPGLSVPLEVAAIAVGLWAAPALLRGYGLLARSLLGPSKRAELARRMGHLARTRAEAIDAGAAEIRRIERDLHDGTQARLIAMGMTLDAASAMIGDNPEAARSLLLEARENSVRALRELRDLVRGIHPPVLADRGLAAAVSALALDSPLPVTVAADLAGRPPAPAESAAYFAVSELLANVSKHAGATQVRIDIRHSGGALRLSVADNGRGGADPAAGTGLRGIQRRLAAFDGMVTVSSPAGGPTAVTVEIPCALS